jgi:hypothetical protein
LFVKPGSATLVIQSKVLAEATNSITSVRPSTSTAVRQIITQGQLSVLRKAAGFQEKRFSGNTECNAERRWFLLPYALMKRL